MRALACLIALALAATPGAALDFTRLCFAGASNMTRVTVYLDNHHAEELPMCDGSRLFDAPLDGCDMWRWEGLDGPGYEYCHEAFAAEMEAFPGEDWAVLFQIVFKPGRSRTQDEVLAFLEGFRERYGLQGAPFIVTGMQIFQNTCGMIPESGVVDETRRIAIALAERDGYMLGPRFTTLTPDNTQQDGCHQDQETRAEDAKRVLEFFSEIQARYTPRR